MDIATSDQPSARTALYLHQYFELTLLMMTEVAASGCLSQFCSPTESPQLCLLPSAHFYASL